ncbi:hypothetical protein K402DRAFT_342380 [Aulographum hederae CBS 113979]|uniref:Uncharacterized protein n=1 Tax=Aulographum hederae CBS 113979 TaxID=1176131 RepID=A0A6G1GKV1_9PEZI|nr:hypothetical protein K402DRAFT_342380 [Aulographum hederae CBS 113979]
MALPPKFAGLTIASGGGVPKGVHTLELFLDYVCPFSKKMFNTVHNSVVPLISQKYSNPPKAVHLLIRPQIQPWHPSSTLCTEAALAVLRLSPAKFLPFSALLFQHAEEFYDANVVEEGRNETYARLAKLGAEVGVDEGEMKDMLRIKGRGEVKEGELNTGNGVTGDVKGIVKANRLLGVHVTPSVMFDGVMENSISSSFTKEDWEDWLQKNIV